MNAVVKQMPGDRTDGYWYILLEGTYFCLMEGGHPNFPRTFPATEKGMTEAAMAAYKFNREHP